VYPRLLHGGSPKGAEMIAAKWASQSEVPQIAFKPDWTKHGGWLSASSDKRSSEQ
jgi:hypothetical protein